jgi:hypothetical protein
MRDTLNIPIAIPTWSLVCMVGGALFTAGTLYTQMATLIESGKKADERITLISEKQIGGLTALANTQQIVQNHELRLSNVEHALLERDKK